VSRPLNRHILTSSARYLLRNSNNAFVGLSSGSPRPELIVPWFVPSAAITFAATPASFSFSANNEELLAPYVTELPQPAEGHCRILLVNNSSLPFTEDRTHPLGVMHKAEVMAPTESERRIVNSTMLVTEGEEIGPVKLHEFLTTDKISQKVY
jgi:hypothetical protein